MNADVPEGPAMALYVLVTLIAALVVYLFYAVIHPERF